MTKILANTKKLKNSANAAEFPKNFRKNNLPSKTIPNQSLPIKEIIRRYTLGLPMGNLHTALYDGGEEFFPDLNKMDLADRQEYIAQSLERMEEIKQKKAKKDADKGPIKAPKVLEKVPTNDDQGTEPQPGPIS